MKFHAPTLEELRASDQESGPAIAVFDPDQPDRASEPATAEALVVEDAGPTADDFLATLTTPPEPEAPPCDAAIPAEITVTPLPIDGPAQCDLDQLEEIQRLGLAVDVATANVEEAKEHLKELREEREGAIEQLMQAVRRRNRPLPLFDRPQSPAGLTATTEAPEAAATPEGAIADAPAPDEQDADSAADDDPEPESRPTEASDTQARPVREGWRSVPIAETGIPANLCEILSNEKNKIDTLGELVGFRSCNPLTRLDKIGPGKAEKIDLALDAFWKANPDLADERAAEPAE